VVEVLTHFQFSVLARGTEAISKQAAQMAQIAAQALVDRPPLQPLLKQPAIEIPISDIEARVDFAIAQIRAKTISTCKSFFLPNHEAEPAITSPYEVLFHSRDEYIKLKFMSIILDDVKTFGETVRPFFSVPRGSLTLMICFMFNGRLLHHMSSYIKRFWTELRGKHSVSVTLAWSTAWVSTHTFFDFSELL
jgi:hypothetical protein